MAVPEHPYVEFSEVAEGSLADYLGVPSGDYSENNLQVNALPFRAYASIFNEHYRDQDLIEPLVLSKTPGQDSDTNLEIQRVAWEKDYFTTARPWEQKGEDVSIPLGQDADVLPELAVAHPRRPPWAAPSGDPFFSAAAAASDASARCCRPAVPLAPPFPRAAWRAPRRR